MIGILPKWNKYRCDPSRRTARCLLVIALAAGLWPLRAGGQEAAPASVEADAIRCWWRTDAGAVQIGEQFSVVLTCAVLDNDAVQVVPDETQLDPTTVQLAPFEVIGGSHPPDQRTADRRFFQRQYTLRIINPDAIGKDVPLPPFSIRYRVNDRLAGQASVEGRELVYVLPPEIVRVLSVVPPQANDIRDADDATFDAVSDLAFRGSMFRIVGGGLMGLGTLMAVIALVRLATRGRKKHAIDARLVPESVALNGIIRELSTVREEASAAWTDALVSRALAALRVAGACALGRVSQLTPTAAAQGPAGHLALRGGLRRSPTVVSSAVTADDLAREIARLSEDGSADRRQLLSELQSALAALTERRYGRDRLAEREALDEAIDTGLGAVKRLAAAHAWPQRYFATRLRPPTEAGQRA